MKLTYKQRLFGIILILFAVFSICLIIFEQREQRKYKTEALESKLDGYVEIIHKYLKENQSVNSGSSSINELMDILPEDIRITIINADGTVAHDKDVSDVRMFDNHLSRPEVLKAQYHDFGSNIRMSASTNQEYMYYAKFYQTYFVRVALPYNIQTQSMLKADNWFIYVVLILFVVVLLLVNLVAGRFGQSISKLKDFALKVKNDKTLPENPRFPDDELGEIGQDLVDIFEQKEKSKQEIEIEREKLVQHFQYSEMGLCLFSQQGKKVLANTHFIQYLNLILDKPTLDVGMILEDKAFSPVKEFINLHNKEQHYKSFRIEKSGKVFSIQVIVFEDKSFEVTIKDITKIEKNRILKQEMTNNVAHELRTPVTSLRGYLETLHDQQLPEEKRRQFIERAYQQIIRLSSLIDDVSLLSNIEETPGRYAMEKINLYQLINELRIDLSDKLNDQGIKLDISVNEGLEVKGNYTLLYSVFRNLMDNSINYGGSGIEIHINNYMEDDKYLYFSYYDTGSGVEEEHLNRLFERFYRVQEGRTRNSGGSGLGLSIVKNAILLHHGEIQAKIHKGSGLEFLFTLLK
ncbi:two-component sensor histidine kinase [Dysgonomonas sp. OttesenSCG-928-M03]|nr:two-component sensor histidine kinase [Dysgonomonas sp. OttesenSCG-928-M03]